MFVVRNNVQAVSLCQSMHYTVYLIRIQYLFILIKI
jgi:hypothetical protein